MTYGGMLDAEIQTHLDRYPSGRSADCKHMPIDTISIATGVAVRKLIRSDCTTAR